jgi:hypothetical protein
VDWLATDQHESTSFVRDHQYPCLRGLVRRNGEEETVDWVSRYSNPSAAVIQMFGDKNNTANRTECDNCRKRAETARKTRKPSGRWEYCFSFTPIIDVDPNKLFYYACGNCQVGNQGSKCSFRPIGLESK